VRVPRALVASSAALVACLGVAEGCGLGRGTGTWTDDADAAPSREDDSPSELGDGATVPDASVTDGADGVADDGDSSLDADAGDAGVCSDPSLILCMRFEDNLTDEAHGQVATTTGTFSYTTGKAGKAVVLGSGNEIHFADGNAWSYSTLTIEAWIRPDAIPTGSARAGIFDKDNSFGVFLYAGGQVFCALQSGVGINLASQGQWMHLACVNDGSSTKLYANGVERVSVSSSPLSTTTAVAAVGGNSPSGDPWVGALDTLRVYARAKSAAEIAAAATP
jgi:hypothetical protein